MNLVNKIVNILYIGISENSGGVQQRKFTDGHGNKIRYAPERTVRVFFRHEGLERFVAKETRLGAKVEAYGLNLMELTITEVKIKLVPEVQKVRKEIISNGE